MFRKKLKANNSVQFFENWTKLYLGEKKFYWFASWTKQESSDCENALECNTLY